MRACWGSPPASFAATTSRVPIFFARVEHPLYTGRQARLKTNSAQRAQMHYKWQLMRGDSSRVQYNGLSGNPAGKGPAVARPQSHARAPARAWLGNSFTFSRMDFSDNPLRTKPTNPRKMNGIVSARNAKNEKLVAVVFST